VSKLKNKKLIYPALLVSLLLIICIFTPSLNKPSIETFKYPFLILNLIKREIGGLVFFHRNMLASERLRNDVGLLKQRLCSLEETRLENTRLKNLLSLKQKSPHKVMAANVIGRSPDNWGSSVIIDKGRRHGLRRGMPVINYVGLIGRITEVGASASRVMLLNDPNFGVSALAQRSRQEGLVSGALSNYLIMKYVPKDADIKASDIIVTSGLTGAYPKGLLIGEVVEVGQEFSGLGTYAVVRPAVNLSGLEEILIVVQ
jgi:rod shape-determining protein MreC